MEQVSFLLAGSVIGLSVAAPVGPMGVLCISRTLACGAATGVCTGAGASTVLVLYCTLALLGLREAGPWLDNHGPALSLSGAALTAWFAWRLVRPRPARQAQRGRVGSLLAAYASAVAFNAVNPMALVLLLAAIAALLGPDTPDGPEIGVVLLGVFGGSLLWWVCLSNVVSALRGRIDGRVLARVNQVAALVLMGFSTLAVLRVLRG